MHEYKQNQCKRKVKNRKNVVGLIIFCITVGIVFLYAYYQNLRKEIDARQKWLETEKKLSAGIWTGIPDFAGNRWENGNLQEREWKTYL